MNFMKIVSNGYLAVCFFCALILPHVAIEGSVYTQLFLQVCFVVVGVIGYKRFESF